MVNFILLNIDLHRRLDEHNSGKSKYTRLSVPFELVFQQYFETLKEARMIEYKLKKYKSRVVIEAIVKDQTIKMCE